jgi:hypothetical protein
MINASLEWIFKILRKKNETKTNSLRIHLIKEMKNAK